MNLKPVVWVLQGTMLEPKDTAEADRWLLEALGEMAAKCKLKVLEPRGLQYSELITGNVAAVVIGSVCEATDCLCIADVIYFCKQVGVPFLLVRTKPETEADRALAYNTAAKCVVDVVTVDHINEKAGCVRGILEGILDKKLRQHRDLSPQPRREAAAAEVKPKAALRHRPRLKLSGSLFKTA